MTNRYIITVFMIFILTPVIVQGNLLTNGDMEDTENVNADYCCNVFVLGCSGTSMITSVPEKWNDTASSLGLVESGTHLTWVDDDTYNHALRLFTHKPENCTRYDGGCTIVNMTTEGVAQYEDYIELDNSSVVLSFYVRKCTDDETPEKCTGIFDTRESFITDDNTGYYYSLLEFSNSTGHTEDVYTPTDNAGDTWEYLEYDFSGVSLSELSFPLNVSLNLVAGVGDYWGLESSCIVLDNVELDYKENASSVDLETENYIKDMLQNRGFAFNKLEDYGSMAYQEMEFNISNAYDGIPLARARVKWRKTGGFCSGGYPDFSNPNIAELLYTNGTTKDIKPLTRVEQHCSGDYYNLYFNFSLPSFGDIENITLEENVMVGGSGDYDVGVVFNIEEQFIYTRQDYDTTIETEGVETTTGLPHIYPVVLLNGSYTNNTVHFTTFNFMNRTEDLTNNIRIIQYNSDGNPDEITTTTLTIPHGRSQHSVNALYEPDLNDYVVVVFYSETGISNTSLTFSLTPGGTYSSECVSHCVGLTYYDAEGTGGVCKYKYYYNDTRCVTYNVDLPTTELGYLDEKGLQLAGFLGFETDALGTATAKGTTLISISLALVFAVAVGFASKKELLSLVTFGAFVVVFTIAGMTITLVGVSVIVLTAVGVLWVFKSGGLTHHK